MDDVVADIVRLPGARLVRLDSGESFKVPYALFLALPLQSGQRLNVEAYRRRIELAEERVALEKAVKLLETRENSRAELLDKLTHVGFSQVAADAAADKLQSLGYLDDRRYAEGIIARYGRRYGVFRLRQELMRRCVPKHIADGLLEEHDPQEGLEAAVNAAKKIFQGKSADSRTLRQKAYAALARRGYGADVIRQALREADGGED